MKKILFAFALVLLIFPLVANAQTWTVTASGFKNPAGQSIILKGMNALVADVIAANPNVFTQFPGMNYIRVNVGAGGTKETDANIDQAIKILSARGIIAQLEDHSGNYSDISWYAHISGIYKNNPLVFLETPNEPPDDSSWSPTTISIINAIRGAGFTGPVGIQTPCCGSHFGQVPNVIATTGVKQLFATNHWYFVPGTNDCQGLNAQGLFISGDEFGNANDGFTIDPAPNGGWAVISATMSMVDAGKCAGAVWAMDNNNHPNGADSVCANRSCTSLTPLGSAPYMKTWLASVAPPPICTPSPNGTIATPGNGTLLDAICNKWTIDAAGNVDENSTAVVGGDGTAQIEWFSNLIYGQDSATKNWFTWNGTNWTTASAPIVTPPTPPPTGLTAAQKAAVSTVTTDISNINAANTKLQADYTAMLKALGL